MNRVSGKSAGVWTLASSILTRRNRTRLANITEHTWRSQTVFMADEPPSHELSTLRLLAARLRALASALLAVRKRRVTPADGMRPTGYVLMA